MTKKNEVGSNLEDTSSKQLYTAKVEQGKKSPQQGTSNQQLIDDTLKVVDGLEEGFTNLSTSISKAFKNKGTTHGGSVNLDEFKSSWSGEGENPVVHRAHASKNKIKRHARSLSIGADLSKDVTPIVKDATSLLNTITKDTLNPLGKETVEKVTTEINKMSTRVNNFIKQHLGEEGLTALTEVFQTLLRQFASVLSQFGLISTSKPSQKLSG